MLGSRHVAVCWSIDTLEAHDMRCHHGRGRGVDLIARLLERAVATRVISAHRSTHESTRR
jgi:hypothetical protein